MMGQITMGDVYAMLLLKKKKKADLSMQQFVLTKRLERKQKYKELV